MNLEQAIEFIDEHGVVLESAQGPVPNLVDAIVGERTPGSWWGHPQANLILRTLRAVRGSSNVLVCRLVQGKVTFVHRRLWPALVRLAEWMPDERLAAIREVHTPSGKHEVEETAFPEWVPVAVAVVGRAMGEAEALAVLGDVGWPWD